MIVFYLNVNKVLSVAAGARVVNYRVPRGLPLPTPIYINQHSEIKVLTENSFVYFVEISMEIRGEECCLCLGWFG